MIRVRVISRRDVPGKGHFVTILSQKKMDFLLRLEPTVPIWRMQSNEYLWKMELSHVIVFYTIHENECVVVSMMMQTKLLLVENSNRAMTSWFDINTSNIGLWIRVVTSVHWGWIMQFKNSSSDKVLK
jgi:hypothetical protein